MVAALFAQKRARLKRFGQVQSEGAHQPGEGFATFVLQAFGIVNGQGRDAFMAEVMEVFESHHHARLVIEHDVSKWTVRQGMVDLEDVRALVMKAFQVFQIAAAEGGSNDQAADPLTVKHAQVLEFEVRVVFVVGTDQRVASGVNGFCYRPGELRKERFDDVADDQANRVAVTATQGPGGAVGFVIQVRNGLLDALERGFA